MQDKVDCLVDTDGDFVVDDSGDLTLATPLQTVQQDIAFRGRTAHNDYGPDPFIGANLPSFRRRPNNRRNGDLMKAAMQEALTRDGRFLRGDIVVDCVPVSKTRVAIPVFVRDMVLGTEDEWANVTAIPVVTFDVDLDTAVISSITGGTR